MAQSVRSEAVRIRLGSRYPLRPLDERGITGRSQADVVRENNGARNVVMPMHRIDPIEQRNFQAGSFSCSLPSLLT